MLEKIITVLYLSGDPVSPLKIAEIIGVDVSEIHAVLPEVKMKLELIGLSLLLTEKDVCIVTKPEFSSLVESFRKDELRGDLTPATLQVLTLIAYLGNPTREQISYIRGVQSAQSIRTLSVRGLVTRLGEVCTLSSQALAQLGVTRKEELPDYERISSEFIKKLSTKEE